MVFTLARQGFKQAAKDALRRWISWARRCRIPAFVDLQRRVVAHVPAIHVSIDHDLSNGLVESMNTKLRLLTRMAFGYRDPDALIGLGMLALGGLCPPLPGPVRPCPGELTADRQWGGGFAAAAYPATGQRPPGSRGCAAPPYGPAPPASRIAARPLRGGRRPSLTPETSAAPTTGSTGRQGPALGNGAPHRTASHPPRSDNPEINSSTALERNKPTHGCVSRAG
jgi:hypothetical protein